MSTYPLLDPSAPQHHHHQGGDCQGCWTVVTLLAEQILPLVNAAAADDIAAPDSQLDQILDLLAAHHAQSYMLHTLAGLVAAIRPGRVSLAQPAGPQGSRQQAAVTVVNELLDAATCRTRSGAAMRALWALEPAARRDVAATLAYTTGTLLAVLPPLRCTATLLLLATPLLPGTLRAIPAAGAVSGHLTAGRIGEALRAYDDAGAQLLPAMVTAWAACLMAHRGQPQDGPPGMTVQGTDRRIVVTAANLIRTDQELIMRAALGLVRRVRHVQDLPQVGILLAGWHGQLVTEQTRRDVGPARRPPP